ncbi:hypothetical protein ACFZC3_21090 [Streptomyces sp. NPDC007903]|uniref:hypothetical protein n=1 Tax=Streptomyces sp. NPDC007903 TaxID=3364786 RepID=UPI0036E65B44
MVPGTIYTVPVTTNNTAPTWSASNEQLTCDWTLPDGSDVTSTSNQPGAQQTLNAQLGVAYGQVLYIPRGDWVSGVDCRRDVSSGSGDWHDDDRVIGRDTGAAGERRRRRVS